MSADPRAALTTFVAALERHLEVATSRQDPDDTAVVAAATALADAFEDYDEALFRATEVATPLGVFEDDEDDDDLDDLDDDDDDEDGVYAGLDDDLDWDDDADTGARDDGGRAGDRRGTAGSTAQRR